MGIHEKIGQKIAAKIIQKYSIKNKELEEKIKREIRFSKYFRHPNIIRLYEVIETEREIIMIMEYASGGELFDLICREQPSENEARRLFQQIIFGLEYLHAHQVSHRDLKPENILLDENNNVKLADFGLSNTMKDGIFLYSSCGSPNYAAPELINGKHYNGAAIDIWSSGVILYTLLTGTLPFNEKQTNKLYQKIRECKYVFPESMSDKAKDLIYRMLQKNPLNRITIAEIKQHKWFNEKLTLFQVIDNSKFIYGNRNKIEKEIIQEMTKSEKINTDNLTEEQMYKQVKGKLSNDLCVIYDFLDTKRTEELYKEKKEKLKNDVNFFKRTKIKNEDLVIKLRDKMRKKILMEEKKNNRKKSSEDDYNSNKKSDELWRVGVICKMDCYGLTQEILKILEKNGYEWKVVANSYRFKCRKKKEYNNENNSGDNHLNVMIELFGNIDAKNKDEYLIDLYKLCGSVMEFLEFSRMFMSAIQKTGLVVIKTE